MTAQQKWDELVERMDDVIASGEVMSRADARELVKRRYRHLADAEYPGSTGLTSSEPRPDGQAPGQAAGTPPARVRGTRLPPASLSFTQGVAVVGDAPGDRPSSLDIILPIYLSATASMSPSSAHVLNISVSDSANARFWARLIL